jgi:hypothetical protein
MIGVAELQDERKTLKDELSQLTARQLARLREALRELLRTTNPT